VDDPILLKAKEALQSALSAGDQAKADVIRQKTLAYIQRSKQPAQEAAPEAPKDTSFSSALQQGLDQPLERIGDTLSMVGAEGAGSFLKNLTSAPENYQPAQVKAAGDYATLDPRGYNWSEIPRAAVEQVGQYAGSLATRAGGAAAGGAVAGPVGAVAGAVAGPAVFEGAQVLGEVAKELAQKRGHAEPTAGDWAQAAATAGVSGGLNAIIPGRGRVLARAAAEGATETAQSGVEQVGGSAVTPDGVSLDPRQAVAEGLTGGMTAGGLTAGLQAKAAAKAAGQAYKDNRVARELDTNPERVASEQRLLLAMEAQRKGAIDPEAAQGPDGESRAVKMVLDDLASKVRTTLDRAKVTSAITSEEYNHLTKVEDNPKAQAAKHNRFLTEGGLQKIAQIPGFSDQEVAAFSEALVDLDSASRNGLYKHRTGPLETAGRAVGNVVGWKTGAVAGGAMGGLPGAAMGAGVGSVAGTAAANVLGGAGKRLDNATGLSTPKAIRNARGRSASLERMGLQFEPSGKALEDVDQALVKEFGEIHGVQADSLTKMKAVVAAQTRRALEEAKQRTVEARDDQAKAKAAQQVQDNEALLQKIADALGIDGEARSGGWHIEAAKANRENFPQLRLLTEDFKSGLDTAVKRGLMSEKAAELALTVPGFKVGAKDRDGTYMAVINATLAAAAKRQGLPWGSDDILSYVQEGASGAPTGPVEGRRGGGELPTMPGRPNGAPRGSKGPSRANQQRLKQAQAIQTTRDKAHGLLDGLMPLAQNGLAEQLTTLESTRIKATRLKLAQEILAAHPELSSEAQGRVMLLAKTGGR
jgi:hypothetical protein